MAAIDGPVSTALRDDIWLGTAALASAAAETAVRDDRAGAVSTFVGTTRGTFEGKVVVRLEYEAYEAMARKQLATLCRTVRAKHPNVLHMAVHHRLGVVAVGDASVVISVSSAHRKEAIGRLGGLVRLEGGSLCAWAGVVGVQLCEAAVCCFWWNRPQLTIGVPSPWLCALALVFSMCRPLRGGRAPILSPLTEACHFAIDELKATVPIWKREVYADGSTWKANCDCKWGTRTSTHTGNS